MTELERKQFDRMALGLETLRAENARLLDERMTYRAFIARVGGGMGRAGVTRPDEWALKLAREAMALLTEVRR